MNPARYRSQSVYIPTFLGQEAAFRDLDSVTDIDHKEEATKLAAETEQEAAANDSPPREGTEFSAVHRRPPTLMDSLRFDELLAELGPEHSAMMATGDRDGEHTRSQAENPHRRAFDLHRDSEGFECGECRPEKECVKMQYVESRYARTFSAPLEPLVGAKQC